MRQFGLIGEHLPHSFSGVYFADKFKREGICDSQYSLYELAKIEELEELLCLTPQMVGFNVTIPYKQQVMRYLTQLSPEAEAVGAVNCVKIDGEELIGYNTDIIGLGDSLRDFLGDARPSHALILGSGGASLAVEYILKELGIEYKVVSRTPRNAQQISYSDITPEVIAQNKLIINATPLGTFPNVESMPEINYEKLTSEHYLFDLVYNPPMTKFLKMGEVQGTKICNGQAMLVGQAEAAWRIWNE